MTAMRAAVVAGEGQLALEEVPVPEPGPGQALLRIEACGVCGSDLHLLSVGALPRGTVMGHEFCGTVAQVGPGASARVGERWVGLPLLPCGACARCLSGDRRACLTPLRIGVRGSGGAYAEYAVIDCERSLPVPRHLDPQTAALCEPLSVGMRAVRRSSLRPGDAVAVIGAGCIGLMVVQCALLAGAAEVSVVEPSAARAAAATDFGATRVLGGEEEARDHFATQPVAVAFECAGARGTLQLAASTVRQGGEVIGVGVHGEDTIRPSTWLMKELTLRMSLEGVAEFPMALRLLADGRLRPLPMVSRRVALEELPAAVEQERSARQQVKMLVTPGRLS